MFILFLVTSRSFVPKYLHKTFPTNFNYKSPYAPVLPRVGDIDVNFIRT